MKGRFHRTPPQDENKRREMLDEGPRQKINSEELPKEAPAKK